MLWEETARGILVWIGLVLGLDWCVCVFLFGFGIILCVCIVLPCFVWGPWSWGPIFQRVGRM